MAFESEMTIFRFMDDWFFSYVVNFCTHGLGLVPYFIIIFKVLPSNLNLGKASITKDTSLTSVNRL